MIKMIIIIITTVIIMMRMMTTMTATTTMTTTTMMIRGKMQRHRERVSVNHTPRQSDRHRADDCFPTQETQPSSGSWPTPMNGDVGVGVTSLLTLTHCDFTADVNPL